MYAHSTLLVLGAGRNQLPLIEAAKRMGLYVVAIDPSPDAPGLDVADAVFTFDLGDFDACLQVACAHRISGVATLAAEFPVPTLGFLCDTLGLPGISQATARLATNKADMRQAFAVADVLQPEFSNVDCEEDALEAVRQRGCRTIIKPAVSNGKKGITSLGLSPTTESVIHAFRRANESTRYGGVLVEQFVDGPEFSVEAVTFQGETQIAAITEKFTSGSPYCVELGHVIPARIDGFAASAIENAAKVAIKALGIDTSASHTEIRLTDRGPKVIEIGARLGGGFITSHLVPLATGIDMLGAAIDLALGNLPRVVVSHRRAAAIKFLTAEPGTVGEISGLSECRAFPGVCDVAVYVSPNDRVYALADNSCRIGHVICESAAPETVMQTVEQAAAQIYVKTAAVAIESTNGPHANV